MNFSGFQQQGFNIMQFQLDEYDIEGPINDSINSYYASNKTDKSISYVMKKMIFTTAQERQVCLTQISQPLSHNLKGIILPKGYCFEAKDENQYILNLFCEKKEGSLKDDIDRRQARKNYFSSAELKGIIEYSFDQLFKFNLKNLSHLNIKPSNLIKNMQGYYSLSEAGYPSQNISLDNDVFRSPQFLEFIKEKKHISKIPAQLRESSDVFSLGLCFAQAATLMSPKQLKCFNDDNYLPQESKEVLDTIKQRYGKDIFNIISVMTAYDDDKRSNLEEIKNREFRNLQDSTEKEFAGGADTAEAALQATPEDDAFVKKIKIKCVQYCEGRSQTLQDFFTRSEQYDKITKTITKYEFRRLLELMDVRLNDYEVKSINRVLDPNDTGKYNMVEFFRDSNVLNQSTKFLSSMMKDDLPSLASEEEELLLQSALKKAYNYIRRENINLERQLKDEDTRSTGWLTFEQFNKVMNKNSIIFREAEFNCIKVKFDLEFKKERIQYLKFVEAMQKSVQVADQELKDQLNIIFQSIYKNFKNFEDFLIKQAKDNQSYISFAAFTTYLSYDGINVTDKMNNKLKEILDPPNSGQIYLSQIKEVFQLNIESHIANLISDLANQLDRKNLSFSGFVTNYFPKSYYIKVATFAEKTYDVLKCNIERKDISFMLEFFKIQTNTQDEFHINKLKDELATFARKNKVTYAQQIFGEGAPTASSGSLDSPSIRKNRDSESDQRDNKSFFGKQKDSSFSAIIAQLKEAAKGFKRQDILKFYGLLDRKNITLNYDTFKKYIEFFQHTEESEVSILFNQLAKNINNTRLVDATEFLSLLDVKTYDEGEIKQADLVGGFNLNDIQKYSPVFIEINRLLNDKGVNAKNHFQSHQSIVQRYFVEERLKDINFKVDHFGRELDMIFQQIGGRIDRVEIQKFVDAVNHFQNIASNKEVLIENKSSIVWFIKIYKGMQEAQISLNVFNRLISGSDRINQDDFTYKMERELGLKKDDNFQVFLESISHKNGDISYSKFEEGYLKEEKAVRALNDMRSMTKSNHKIISQAFANIDINGDGLITKNEFIEMMPIINSSLNRDDLNYLFERLDLNNSGSISLDEFRDNIQGKDALKNQQDFENHLKTFYTELQQNIHNSRKSFDEIFLDSKEKQMTTAEFEKIIGRIGQRLDDKQKITTVMEDLTFGGVIFNRMRLKKKYEKYIDSYKEDAFNRNKNSGGGNNQKQDAYEFVKIIKAEVKKENLYFDDVFGRKRNFSKADFSDALYNKLNLNTKRHLDLYDNFWNYFKDSYNNELDFKLFEEVYNDLRENIGSSQRQDQGRDNSKGGQRGNVTQTIDKFLSDNSKDCEYEFQNFHNTSITINEFLRAIKKAGLNQSFRDDEIEEYCQQYNCILKNGEIDYPFLLEKIKRKNRDRDDRNDNKLRDDRNRNNDRVQQDRNDSRLRDDRDDWKRNNDRDFDRNDKRDDRRDDRRDDKRDDRRDDRNDRRDDRNDRDDRNRGKDQDRYKNDRDRKNRDDDSDDERNNRRVSKQVDKKDYQAAVKNLLDQMVQNKCNIQDIVKDARLDVQKDGVVDEKDFWQEMKLKRVKLSGSDQDAIEQYVSNNKGMLNYQKLDGDIRSFIEEWKKSKTGGSNSDGRKKNKKKKMKSDELNRIIDEFRNDMNKYIKSKNVGIRYAFKRFDKDNDNFISFTEFENGLKDNRICSFFEQYESIDGIVENLFDVFDEDKELKIDLVQFTKVLFPEQSNIEIAPLMKQFKTVLSGTTEEDLRKEYQKIDKNEDGKISFTEFQKYIKQITKAKMTDIEIERLFQHFLQDKSSEFISIDHFVAVILDDHMNFEKIRQKIIEYKDKKDRTLKSIYDQYSGPQGSINLHSLQMFFQVLKLEFNMDQLDELFSFLDTNGDGMITYDEFYDAIEKAEVSQFQLLKRMRREFVKAKCDIAKELTNRSFGRDTVTFGDFKDCIQQFKVDVKPFEYDALYKKYGRNDNILYNNFLQDLLSNKYDIEPIKKKIKDYISKEGLSYQQFFDLFASTPDLLNFPDFQNLLLQCEANIPKDEVLEAFSAFDLNNSRKIHKNEFIDVLEGRIAPQAAIGFNNMLQNALNYQPVNQMENSMAISTMLGAVGSGAGYYGYGVSDNNLAQSQFIQTQYNQPSKSQFAPQVAGNQFVSIPGTPMAYQGTQNVQNPMQEEITLKGDCTIEEIIDKIRQVCQNKFMNVFYLFASVDKKFVCGYANESDFEEIMSKGLGIKARSSHYIDISQRYMIKEKKLLGYMNILKEIMGLNSLVKQSMIYAIKIQGVTIDVFVNNLLKTYKQRQITIDVLKGYIYYELNIINSTEQQVEELFKNIMNYNKKEFGSVDLIAAYLTVTNKYDGRVDSTDRIDVLTTAGTLSQIKKICNQIRISPIDLFQYSNKIGNYMIDPKTFAKILEDLDLNLTTNQLYSIMQQYQLENMIRIMALVSQIEDLPELFRKVCLNVMKINSFSFEMFFSHFSFDQKYSKWTRQELQTFFTNFSFYPSQRELYNLYQVIARQNSDIYPNQLAEFIGIHSSMQPQQCVQYYEQILANVSNTLLEYNRNRPALLSRLATSVPPINQFDVQYAQLHGTFVPHQERQQQQQQQQQLSQQPMFFGQNFPSAINPDPLIQRTETVYQDPRLLQTNPKQVQFQQQPTFYDEPPKRYDQQSNYDKRPYDQQYPPQIQQQQFQSEYQQYNPQQQQQFGAQPLNYNDPRRLQDSRYDQIDPRKQQESRYDQADPRRNFDQSNYNDQRNQQDRYGRQQDQYNFTPSGPAQPGPGGYNQQAQQQLEQSQKNRRIIEEQQEFLSNALQNKGGSELLNKGGREGLLSVNQFETCLTRFYDMTNSPALSIFIDSFLENSNMISVQTVFNRCQYDHRKFVDNQEINKQFGVGRKQELQASQKASSANDQQKVRNMRQILLDIFKNDFQQLSETFFMNGPLIDIQNFMSVARQIFQSAASGQQQPTDIELEWLFNEIDANSGGTITYNEFELYFADSEEIIQQRRHKKFCITPQMEQEIQELFRVVDVNDDKQISVDELNILFSKIGSNASPQELDEYIKRYDKNNDRSISYEEFKVIMEEKIKNEMLTSESIIDELKKEFRKVDLRNTRTLNIGQLGQVFSNLGVQLKPSELSALFNEIDVDGSKTVDIDELIAFITRNSDGVSTLAQTAILNVRSSRKFSIRDLLDTFKQMPSNYRLSFMRSQHQKGFNLPSSTLRPKVTASLIYSDLHYDNPGLIDNNLSVLDRKYSQPAFQMEFTFKQATGIPIPDANAFPRDQITKRIAYVSFYDTNRQYIGNTCRIEAIWNPNNEDIWEFDTKQLGDQTLYARYVGFDKNKHGNLNICIELVMHYLPKKCNSKCDLEISVSHILIPLQSIVKNGEVSFNLIGGEPNKPANIKPEDIRAKRSGYQGLIKTFKKVESQLKIQINTQITNKNHSNDLPIMPDIIVMRRANLPFFTIYREYFGFRSICKKEIDINLACDPIFKTFSKVVDCPDTVNVVADFWRNEVAKINSFLLSNRTRLNKLEDLKNALQKMMNHLYLLFSYDKFNFSPNDPTASVYCFPSVLNERNRLLSLCLEDLRIILGIKSGQPQNLKIQDSSTPFTIEELLDDNQEDDNAMFQEFLARKTSVSVFSRK